MTKPTVKGIYVILSTDIQSPFPFSQLTKLVIEGGAEVIQFRHKGTYTLETFALAEEIAAVCQAEGIPFIINDWIDVALAIGASGVHLGQEDMPIQLARQLMGPDKIIGGTACCLEDVQRAAAEGADYVGFGHIYPTSSKYKPYPSLGLDILRDVAQKCRLPLIAIGGIDHSTIGKIKKCGASGAAVISAVCLASDPKGETERLVKAFAS